MFKRLFIQPKTMIIASITAAMCLSANYVSAAQSNLPTVRVAEPVLQEIIDWQEFTGRFEAVQRVDVRARVTGYLDEIHFKDGQLVEKGDLLFVIDPRPYQAALARAKAEQSRYDSQLKLSQLELTRGEQLLGQKAISAEEVDTRRARFQEANASLAAAQAAVLTAELDLQYSRITAPVTGRISNRYVDIGNLIGSGDLGTPLTTLVTLNPLYFVFDVSEADYLKFIRQAGGGDALTGQSRVNAEIKLLDETEWTHSGTIDFVDNRLDEGTATLRMRAIVDNQNDVLRPGLFGRVRISVEGQTEALLVPDKAILSDQAMKILMIVDEQGVVQPRPVITGPLVGQNRVIRSGIQGDEQVIVEGLLRARPGVQVNPVPVDTAAGE